MFLGKTQSALLPTAWALSLLGLFSFCTSQVIHSSEPTRPASADTGRMPVETPATPDVGLSDRPMTASGRATDTPAPGVASMVLSRGKLLFDKQCVICHGESGDGAGKFAYLMNPRPRDLKLGKFKLSTTQNQIPSDDDLLRTISRGMPGSAMPPWGHLPLADLRALVAYVRKINVDAMGEELNAGVQDGTFKADEVAAVLASRTQPGPPIVIPPEPKLDDLRWFNGRRVYLEACASCHGQDGHPVAEAVKFDDEGYPDPPRSFVNGVFKGGMEGPELYCRIVKGMRGTPMPASEGNYSNDDLWDLIHYVQSLARAGSQDRAQLRQGTIIAPSVGGPLPNGPKDAAWTQARPLYVGLTPVWWTDPRVEGLVVQALHNDRELALRLSWIDPTTDDRAVKTEEFRDAVAIQFSLSSDPPFYMGDNTQHGGVNIWMWKADRQKNISDGYQDVDAAFRNRAVDMYPECPIRSKDMSSVDWPLGSIAEHHPSFITAWGAGNLVADPTLKTPVECLVAKGPGTLSGKPANVQRVRGQAVYERGVWIVQMQRALELPCADGEHGGQDERAFRAGDYLPVSFAIWDGSAGDRDGKKNISIWQKLVIE
jgi:mono/diheme cytochrome c family protein